MLRDAVSVRRMDSRRRARVATLAGLVALLVCLIAALGAVNASAVTFEDFSGPAFDILAPGAEGGLTPGPFATDQAKLYDDLTPLRGGVTMKDLNRFYLSEKFGVQGSVMRSEETGRAGLEILRDSHDVAHIYGTTRADVMFGSGWVASEDRQLLLLQGLGPAFAAALSIPGVNPFELLLTGRSFKPSVQAFEFVAKQEASLIEKGPEGEQVMKDLENWAEGVNAYQKNYPEQLRLPPINAVDAIAGFAFIGSIFGNGGGGEVANDEFLANLEKKYGAEEGLKIFRDLREVNDPEAPTTAAKAFPYDQVPTGATPGSPLIEPGTISPAAAHAVTAAKASRRKISNFLLVGAKDSASGHPLAVMGPQLGYFYPEIVFQADMHGPGIDAEGIVAPISPYVFIGRGRDFAWSLTSADSQNTMQFLEKLCNPEGGEVTKESEYYEYKGECIKMNTFDAGEIGAGNGEPAHEVFFKETVHGPVSGTVMVGGKPYAIANDRANRGREPAGELAFSKLDSDQVHNPNEFFEAANDLETTFNMSYLDNEHIAYFSTGRLPVLAEGTDPSLPTLGTGEYDWKGFLSQEQHPHEVDPASNFFTNWNNKPAPEWGAASDNWGSYGPVHRVQMYTGFKKGMNEASDASIMNRAATEDLRATKAGENTVWPNVEKVLAGGPAPSKLAEEAVQIVNQYSENGGVLLGVKQPREPGAAIMDAIWTPIAEAVLGPVLGELMTEFKSLSSPDNPPNTQGSSFGSGWYGYVSKDLRSLLGLPVKQAYSRQYCGNGNLTACRESLWSAIQKAVEGLAKEQGNEPSNWRAPDTRIDFPPLLSNVTMRWTNRSTFQQVITFTGHAPGE